MMVLRWKRARSSGDKNQLSSSIVFIISMKNILCIGGSGLLGQNIVSLLSKYHVFNVDFKTHNYAHQNILLHPHLTPAQNNAMVIDSVQKLQVRFNAIVVSAGGWRGGNVKDEDYFQKVRVMSEANLNPSLLAAHLATRYLIPDGLVMFTGAAAIYKTSQPDMIAYALAKTGVHYIATALAHRAQEFKGRVLTILPQVIDTPENRQAMPKADFSSWSKPTQISELILSWIEGHNLPFNGAFIQLKVKDGNLQPQLV